MRIGVIGAGAVGGAISALLARGGHLVQVAARGENLIAIETYGLRLRGAWGEYTARVGVSDVLTHAPELVVIATKAQDAASAIEANSELLGGVPVLVVQNGLGGLTECARLLPTSDVVGGLALFAASLSAPGEVTITTTGAIYVGGGEEVATLWVAQVLGEAMPTVFTRNFVGAQWTKLVINQVNALPAITGLSVQEVIAQAGLRRILTQSMRENVSIGTHSGVRFDELSGLGNSRLRNFARLPIGLAEALPRRMAKHMGSVPNPGSTLQSIRRGLPTEIDYLNGAVVQAAAEIGRDAPVNAALVRLVHEVEGTGVFLSPEEVIRRIASHHGAD